MGSFFQTMLPWLPMQNKLISTSSPILYMLLAYSTLESAYGSYYHPAPQEMCCSTHIIIGGAVLKFVQQFTCALSFYLITKSMEMLTTS